MAYPYHHSRVSALCFVFFLAVSVFALLCVRVFTWSWVALQFVLQDVKIALANPPSLHPLFVCTAR